MLPFWHYDTHSQFSPPRFNRYRLHYARHSHQLSHHDMTEQAIVIPPQVVTCQNLSAPASSSPSFPPSPFVFIPLACLPPNCTSSIFLSVGCFDVITCCDGRAVCGCGWCWWPGFRRELISPQRLVLSSNNTTTTITTEPYGILSLLLILSSDPHLRDSILRLNCLVRMWMLTLWMWMWMWMWSVA